MSTIHVETNGGTTRVTFARPAVRNAFNAQMIEDLTRVLREVAVTARVVVLRGEGTFCAGADLSWMEQSIHQTSDANVADARRMATLFAVIDEAPCLTVACVEGAALGGGAGVACCCDVVVAADDARFGFTEVRLGLVPAVISPFVIRRIGVARARRYFLTGEVFAADVAQRIGLVDEVTPAAGLDQAVTGICDAALRAGPRAMAAAKGLVRTVAANEPRAATEYTIATIAALRVQDEAQEGMRAFLEHRPPSWLSRRPL